MADIRETRTTDMLCQALEELMGEKPYEKITVSEICERSTVRRGTFYKHFDDKDALLRYYLNTFTLRFLEGAGGSEHVRDLAPYATHMHRRFLTDVEQPPAIRHHIARPNVPVGVLDMIVAQVADGIITRIDQAQAEGCADPEIPAWFLGTFYSYGMVHMMRSWLIDRQGLTKEDLERFCTTILLRSCAYREQDPDPAS